MCLVFRDGGDEMCLLFGMLVMKCVHFFVSTQPSFYSAFTVVSVMLVMKSDEMCSIFRDVGDEMCLLVRGVGGDDVDDDDEV